MSWDDAKALLGDFNPCEGLDEAVAGDCRYYFDSATDPCEGLPEEEADQCYAAALSFLPEDIAASLV
jgi:hypothetical protein